MAVVALIKFSQGLNVGSPGVALSGVPNVLVNIENDSIVDIQSWKIDLVYVPPGSTVSIGTLATGDSNTPFATFTPDNVRGCYRVVLTVYSGLGQSGSSNRDIRNFGVPTTGGFIFPPYQELPPKLPVLGSGFIGEKPDELNFGNQPYGWDGIGTDGLILDLLRQLAAFLASGGGGGGDAPRGRLWWNTSSNDDGTFLGAGDVFSADFVAELDRMNMVNALGGPITATLPEVTSDDHNRRVGFKILGAGPLNVTASGSAAIVSGVLVNSTVPFRGGPTGTINVLQYDAFFDKWVQVEGGYVLDGAEVRSATNRFTSCEIALTGGGPYNDAATTSGSIAQSDVIGISVDAAFDAVTGIDASGASTAQPWDWRKELVNIGGVPVVCLGNDGGSSSTNQFDFGSMGESRQVLHPGERAMLYWNTGKWGFYKPQAGLETRRDVQTTDVGDMGVHNELVFVDSSGGPVTVTAPGATGPDHFVGQRFAVKLASGTAVTIDPDGQSIEDPNTRSIVATPVVGSSAGFYAEYVWDGNYWRLAATS